MQRFLSFLAEQTNNPQEGKVSKHNRGVLHELLTGYHLQGGKHMESHTLISSTGTRHTPEQAHDIIKAQIHPNDYAKISNNAKSAAKHIKSTIEAEHPGHKIKVVRHTSKAGDTQKETGVPAAQSGKNSDPSDIYVTTRHPKTGEIKKHGLSLKTTDKPNKNVQSSSLGIESSGSKAKELYKKHQDAIIQKHPKLKSMNPAARKEWGKSNPKHHAAIKQANKKLLHAVASHQANEINNHIEKGNHEHVVEHLRTVLAARRTPAEIANKATFKKHTTFTTSAGVQHHNSNPGTEHEHFLSQPQHIHAEASGGTTNFYHTHPKTGKVTRIASQAHKLSSQSDPLSGLVSAGKPE